MGIIGFFKSSFTLLKLARKPSQKEYSITLRITLLGIGIMGLLAFIIRFVALAFQGV
ncbi:MAG: protein translocase SEC61 complex subunit gamma [Nitrososphaerota archaeon]